MKSPPTTVSTGPVGVGPDGLVNDGELIAELGRRAGHVHRPQHLFPEPSPHRQERVVGNVSRVVLGSRLDLGAGQVTGDLA